jgi:hypothetical protein
MQTIRTAIYSKSQCLICKERKRRLRQVKDKDITHAYLHHKILIRKGSVVCDAHYAENGRIRPEEFYVIQTSHQTIGKETQRMFGQLANTAVNAFDQFKEIDWLEEDYCLSMTGWTKDEFIEFSSYIFSIHNTEQRSKHQLVALYRYWIRSGVDQKSLAKMFGNGAEQNVISNYLDQIRTAIYKDFVDFFLGAHQERKFYLKFNTFMTHTLHHLREDDLVVVADGTYTRIEKSRNNDFQYKTYSGQKGELLFKPFLIVCADGYIIDCYGPFQANVNDAEILDYILRTDESLNKILLPDKTMMVLDRGKQLKNVLEPLFSSDHYFILKGLCQFSNIYKKNGCIPLYLLVVNLKKKMNQP